MCDRLFILFIREVYWVDNGVNEWRGDTRNIKRVIRLVESVRGS